MSDLSPLSPEEGVEMYLDHRRGSLRDRTLQAQHYRLKLLLDWFGERGITNLNDLSGRDLAEFHRHRRKVDGVAETTIRGNSYTYRSFLEYCEAIEAVEPDLSAKMLIPELDKYELKRDHRLDPDRVEDVLAHLDRFAYASRVHVTLALLLHVGCRLGGLRALDVDDYCSDEQFVEFAHRPETGTPLKNGRDGERLVHLSEEVVEIVDDYVAVNRPDVTDEHGRRPLVATRYGRASESAVRQSVYRVFRPCTRTGECPHDRVIDECEAFDTGRASRCPSSRAPHDVRSAAIMRMRRLDVPPDVVSERVNATREVIELHYDERDERERMEQRRKHLEDL